MKLCWLFIVTFGLILTACGSGNDGLSSIDNSVVRNGQLTGDVQTSGDVTPPTRETENNNPEKPKINGLMFPISLEAKVNTADYIIHGKVLRITGKVELVSEQIRMPISTIGLQVLESWKGSPGLTTTFKSPGAVIREIPYFSEQMPQFSAGEEVIVFLKNFDSGIFPVGHIQGKYEIRNGAIFFEGNRLSLDAFKKRVQSAVEVN